MIFTVSIHSSFFSSQASLTAYHFCTAALKKGHHINRIFFYMDGVYNASNLAEAKTENWQTLSKENAIELIVCVTSGLRRGIKNDNITLAPGFTIAGLTQFVEAVQQADRTLIFQ